MFLRTIVPHLLVLADCAGLAAATARRAGIHSCKLCLHRPANATIAKWSNSTLTDPTTTTASACLGCTGSPAVAVPTCAGCVVSAIWSPSLLSYPASVSTTSSTMTATVIPLVTEYPNGERVTSYSTVVLPAPNATTYADFRGTPVFDLTWATYGTVL